MTLDPKQHLARLIGQGVEPRQACKIVGITGSEAIKLLAEHRDDTVDIEKVLRVRDAFMARAPDVVESMCKVFDGLAEQISKAKNPQEAKVLAECAEKVSSSITRMYDRCVPRSLRESVEQSVDGPLDMNLGANMRYITPEEFEDLHSEAEEADEIAEEVASSANKALHQKLRERVESIENEEDRLRIMEELGYEVPSTPGDEAREVER